MRSSSNLCTTASVSSVQPSPTTISSHDSNVCRSTLSIVYRKTALRLYVAVMIEIEGFEIVEV